MANSWLYAELIFVNTDRETVEKRLRTKDAATNGKKVVIPETDDEDGGTANKGKKKRLSTPGALVSTYFVYLTDIHGAFQIIPMVRTEQSRRRRKG